MEVDQKFRPVLLEALEDLMYKISLQQNQFKGQPLTKRRRDLTQKQALIEELQHLICTAA